MKQGSPKAQHPIIQAQANHNRLSMVHAPPRLTNATPILSDGYASIEMDTQSLERLRRFHLRTVPTMGGPEAAEFYQNHALKMACSVSAHTTHYHVDANTCSQLGSVRDAPCTGPNIPARSTLLRPAQQATDCCGILPPLARRRTV